MRPEGALLRGYRCYVVPLQGAAISKFVSRGQAPALRSMLPSGATTQPTGNSWSPHLSDRYIIDKLFDSEDDFEALAYVRLAGALGVDQHSITKAAEHFNMNELVEIVYKEGVEARHG